MVPGVYDTAANMFALRSGLLGAGRFLDVYRKLRFGPGRNHKSIKSSSRIQIDRQKHRSALEEIILGVVKTPDGRHLGPQLRAVMWRKLSGERFGMRNKRLK